jgi:hypothetical protein
MSSKLTNKWIDSSAISFSNLHLSAVPGLEADGTGGIQLKGMVIENNGTVTIAGDATFSSNLAVNGTTTVINTEITSVDKLVVDQTGNAEALIVNKTGVGVGTAVRIINAGTSPALTTFGASPHVGIGTENPQNTLHVNTSAIGGGVAVFDNGSGYEIGRLFRNEATSNGRFTLYSGNVTKINISSASDSYFNGGNVGIGTANPKLQQIYGE